MKYAKAWAAFGLAVCALVVSTLADNKVDAGELSSGASVFVDAVLALVTAGGVAWVRNADGADDSDGK